MTEAKRKAIEDAVLALVRLIPGGPYALDARAVLCSLVNVSIWPPPDVEQHRALEAAVRSAYAAGLAEGRAQVAREREADRLDTIATEHDR